MLSPDDVKVSRYISSKECKAFRCEKAGYAKFIQNPNEAEKCQFENLSVTYLFKIKDGTIVGYITLAMSSLRKKRLPKERSEVKRFPNVPSLLLGQMARDSRFKGQGVGQIMLDWVLSTAHRMSDDLGCRYVVMNAELDKQQHYKKRFKFESLPRESSEKTVLMFFDLGVRNGFERAPKMS